MCAWVCFLVCLYSYCMVASFSVGFWNTEKYAERANRGIQRGEGARETHKRDTRETTLTLFPSFLWHINGNISRYLINPSHIRKTAGRHDYIATTAVERFGETDSLKWWALSCFLYGTAWGDVVNLRSTAAHNQCLWLDCRYNRNKGWVHSEDWECLWRFRDKRQLFFSPTSDSSATYLTYVKVFLPPDISDPHRFFCAFCFVALKHISTWLFSLTGHFGNICSLLSPVVKEVFWPLTKVKDITIWNKQKKLQ